MQGADHRLVALHPAEQPTAEVPEDCRWHLSGGIAYPSGDGSSWCRIPHRLLCPHRTVPEQAGIHLNDLRLRLALRTRRLIDTGLLAPAPPHLRQPPDTAARPVVRILLNVYLASAPVEDLRCVAQDPHPPCLRPVLDASSPAGRWRLLPAGFQHGQRERHLPPMAVYDLGSLPHTEQLRWRTQRCPAHAAGPADLGLTGWQVFDPLLHATHIRTRLPHRAPHSGTGM
jgi:hypothetical protein